MCVKDFEQRCDDSFCDEKYAELTRMCVWSHAFARRARCSVAVAGAGVQWAPEVRLHQSMGCRQMNGKSVPHQKNVCGQS